MKVLIADDHAQMREIIRKLVLSLPEVESVIECENGEEALSISIKEQPDLILMDLLMKKMDGLTAIKKIKSAGVLSKIIVVSQISEKEFRDEVISIGADYFLNKENLLQLPDVIRSVTKNKWFL